MAVPKLRFKEFDRDWDFNKIGEIFKVTSGSTPLRSDKRFFENAHIPWVKTTDLNNSFISKTEEMISEIALKETSVKILPKGTVFVAMYGGFNQIGRTGLLLDESACNQALSAIYPNEKIDSFFLLTYLNQKVDDWKNVAASSRNDPNITKSDVLAFPIVYPSKPEQTKIASFLSAVDEKISQLTQKHELLSQYKQGMMQKLFSQQIRFKADDGSEFGEWGNLKIFDLAIDKTLNNGVFNDQNKVGKGYKLINVLDMYINRDIDESRLKLLDLSTKDFEKNKVYYGDIFFTRSSLVKEGIAFSNVYLGNSNDVTYDGHLIKLSPNLNRVNPIFLNYILKTHVVRKQLIKGGKTATMTTIGQQEVGNTIVSLPCLEEQTKIANFLSSIDQKIEVVAQQIEQAKQWKKGLLQQMFV